MSIVIKVNLNWWTGFDYLQRDKSLKFHFAKKVVFVPTISVLHAMQEQFNRFSFIKQNFLARPTIILPSTCNEKRCLIL